MIPYGCDKTIKDPKFDFIEPEEIFKMWTDRLHKDITKFLLIITDSCFS